MKPTTGELSTLKRTAGYSTPFTDFKSAETALSTSATGESSAVMDTKCVVETGSSTLKGRTPQAVSE